MGKLSNLKIGFGSLPPRFSKAPDDESARYRMRDAVKPWRAWYKLARWQQLRLRVFLRDSYTCQFCNNVEGNTSLLVADHKRPHRGDELLFWDEDNVQTLCKSCHDSRKQSIERRAGAGGGYNAQRAPRSYNPAQGGRSKV